MSDPVSIDPVTGTLQSHNDILFHYLCKTLSGSSYLCSSPEHQFSYLDSQFYGHDNHEPNDWGGHTNSTSKIAVTIIIVIMQE